MSRKLITILIIMLMTTTSFAYVIQGTVTEPVIDGNIADADNKAREKKALLRALKKLFWKAEINSAR